MDKNDLWLQLNYGEMVSFFPRQRNNLEVILLAGQFVQSSVHNTSLVMAHFEGFLVKGAVIEKGEFRDAFDRIDQMVTQWERATYPEMRHLKLHKGVKNSADRMKLICHLNSSNVVESDRVCTFKLIAATKDGNETAVISKNVCLDHSCQTPEFKAHKGGPSGKARTRTKGFGSQSFAASEGESRYLLGKKRKLEQEQDNFREAWRLINTEKMFAENCFPEKAGYLDELGIYEASDLKDLDLEHIETLGALLKEIPRKRWTKLLTSV